MEFVWTLICLLLFGSGSPIYSCPDHQFAPFLDQRHLVTKYMDFQFADADTTGVFGGIPP